MWVLIALAGLVLLVVLVLSVPLDAALRVDVYGRPKFKVKLAWLFGLVSKEITEARKRPEKEKRAAEEKKKPEEGKKRLGDIFEILKTRGLLKQIVRLVKDILRLPKIKEFLADLRVGLGDPADTGLLFALIGPASPLLNYFYPYKIRLQPSFADEAVLEGFLYGKVRLQPIRLAPPFLRFLFSLAAIRTAKRLVLRKWKEKR